MTRARKAPQPAPGEPAPAQANGHAHHIWLAGLGAWAQAQAEGGKLFETLVREGLALQQRTGAGLAQAAQDWAQLGMQAGAARWEGLTGLFDQRVAQSLSRMGHPTPAAWEALQARVAALEAALTAASAPPAGAASTTRGRTRPSTRRR